MRLISRMGHCHVKQWDNIAHRGSDPTMDWLSWCAGRFWEWWMRETTVFQPNLKKSTHWCMKSRLNMRAAFKRASLLKPTMPVMAHLLSRTALLMLRPGQLPLWVVTCTATSCPTLLLWVFVTGKTSKLMVLVICQVLTKAWRWDKSYCNSYTIIRGRALFQRLQKGSGAHIQLQKKFMLLSCPSETSTCHFMTPPRPVVHSNGLCYSTKQVCTRCDALPILAEMLSAPATVSDMPTTGWVRTWRNKGMFPC